jgi:hypothetical protein
MNRRLIGAMAALATTMTMLAATGASPVASAETKAATLRVTPQVFVGGQALNFVGKISGAPNSRLKVQTHFNRPGDSWSTRDGIVGTTNGKGEFDFIHPAPNNFGISFRVKAANGRTSSSVRFEPRQQEVALSLNGGPEQAPGTVKLGDTFTIDVDTTPTGRGNLGRPAPAFPGRKLTLQQRVKGDRWKTVASAPASTKGTAQFVRTADELGPVAYRVRQADIKTGGNQIGWFPSFPLEISVVARRAAARVSSPAPVAEPLAPRRTPTSTTLARSGGATPLASQRYKWGPTQWDFAWEVGESLTDRPFRGRKLKGRWIDRSNGSGRAAHYNGGMALSTNISEFPGTGDHGTTSVTLKGNALKYGRWEFRRRVDVFENVGRDYRVKIDLVPAKAKHDHCGSNVINVANVKFNSTKARIGVKSYRAKKSWAGTRRIPRLGDEAHSFGIEVTRNHITWFLDGKSLATVKNRKAVPGVPLTPRLSLVGQGQQEMRRTRVLYDWQRGWRLNKQAKKAATGKGLKSKKLKGAC